MFTWDIIEHYGMKDGSYLIQFNCGCIITLDQYEEPDGTLSWEPDDAVYATACLDTDGLTIHACDDIIMEDEEEIPTVGMDECEYGCEPGYCEHTHPDI